MDPYQLADGILSIATAALAVRSEHGLRESATIDEYLEWLRRANHAELVTLIEENAGLLKSIEALLKTGSDETLKALDTIREILVNLSRDSERLVPGSGTSPILPYILEGVIKDVPEEAVIVHLGTIVACVSDFPFSILGHRGESMFALDRRNGEILFSANIFNRDGKIACEIVNNEMHVNRNYVFRLIRTPHSLSIIDDEKRHVVDIEYINKTAIRVTGEFYMRRGVLVTMNSVSVKFIKDDQSVRIVKPVGCFKKPQVSSVDIDFPDDHTQPPIIRLEGMILDKGCVEWTGPKRAAAPDEPLSDAG